MKRTIALLVMSCLFFAAGGAQAQEWSVVGLCCDEAPCCKANFYAKILGGANFLQNSSINGNKATYKSGYIVAGSVGYSCCYGLHLEAEYAFRRNGINNICFFLGGSSHHGYYQASSYMANLLWDLPVSLCRYSFWNIRPYIGAGIGYDFHRMHASNDLFIFDQKWKHFSWQIMTGLAYPIFCNTEMALEYKFHQGGSHFYNHSIGIALTYAFGL